MSTPYIDQLHRKIRSGQQRECRLRKKLQQQTAEFERLANSVLMGKQERQQDLKKSEIFLCIVVVSIVCALIYAALT